MLVENFSYELPDELIARYPLSPRTASRLLCLRADSAELQHKQFTDVLDLLQPGDLLVFNNTKVIPARLFGQKMSGGKIEALVERIISPNKILAQIRASKSPKVGAILQFESFFAEVIAKKEAWFELEFQSSTPMLEILNNIGHMPLPPYMQRSDELSDKECYQTVYAKELGAVAAPTAGLHFDENLLQAIINKGVNTAFVTLHVGAGTFQPVRVAEVEDHQMHAEFIQVDKEVCEKIIATKKNNKRIIAVGTTTVRCLETACKEGEIKSYSGDTNIFIYPGYQFKCVDALITNFHLPRSTLLMLVSAFAGYENVMCAYQEAIAMRYRFYSYGDAMYLERFK